jgi:NTE family protein
VAMKYPFKNLVFEGGGVRGLAYVGAMEVLEKKGVMKNIQRVGGTSVGAINATMVALGYSQSEQRDKLWKLDFNNFEDHSWCLVSNLRRVWQRYGWNKGDAFLKWIEAIVANKLGNPKATFKDLKYKGKRELYVYGTNLCTHYGEVFSAEHTPNKSIAEAVRISMSIPLFFTAVRNPNDDVYVDGGCLNNYPIKLFDREKYIAPDKLKKMGLRPEYYNKINEKFLKEHPDRSPYIYNKETLGFRLDTKEEIAAFRYNEMHTHEIKKFTAYVKELVATMLEIQNNIHLHSDDWQRTIYVDTLEYQTTQFNLTDADKEKLVQQGRDGTNEYFKWFDTSKEKVVNRPNFTLPVKRRKS